MAVFKSVDRLAALQSEINRLAEEAEAIKSSLRDRGEGEYCGKQFKAVIVTFERETFDLKKAKSLLTKAQIKKLTHSTESTAVRILPR